MSDPHEMNETQRKLARHALGLPNSKNRSYRNRYFTSGVGEAHNAWLGLAQRQLAVQVGNYFELTLVGAQRALNVGEHLDTEDFPAEVAP